MDSEETEDARFGPGLARPPLLALGVILLLGSVAALLTPVGWVAALSLSFALWFCLVLPGYCILLHVPGIDSLERILLGVPVGAAVIPLLLYHWNTLGGGISLTATAVFVLTISGTSLVTLWVRDR